MRRVISDTDYSFMLAENICDWREEIQESYFLALPTLNSEIIKVLKELLLHTTYQTPETFVNTKQIQAMIEKLEKEE